MEMFYFAKGDPSRAEVSMGRTYEQFGSFANRKEAEEMYLLMNPGPHRMLALLTVNEVEEEQSQLWRGVYNGLEMYWDKDGLRELLEIDAMELGSRLPVFTRGKEELISAQGVAKYLGYTPATMYLAMTKAETRKQENLKVFRERLEKLIAEHEEKQAALISKYEAELKEQGLM